MSALSVPGARSATRVRVSGRRELTSPWFGRAFWAGQILAVASVALIGSRGEPGGPADSNRTPRPVRFSVDVAAAPAPPPPAVAPLPAPEITASTVLNAPVDEPAADVAPKVPASSDEHPTEPPRRVYGVRKVFAHGLGSGSAGDGGLVVKIGNTVDGVADTLTATPEDLRGELAPMSTITRAPEPVHREKPTYSELLTAQRASGTVVARLLIDIDGQVKAVRVISDFGFDSRALAIAAFEKFRFRPALVGSDPAAVWIVHKIRFEFEE